VPLSRFYANHANELPSPFKALQIGSVWRADRPQRGRYRQFTQCDIDILGEPTNLAEIELILATTTTLGKLGFENFEIRINERRILKAMAAFAGFSEDQFDEVFITLDKMDKIGLEGVSEELLAAGYEEAVVSKYLGLYRELSDVKSVSEGLSFLSSSLGEALETSVADSLREIAAAVEEAKEAKFDLVFDPTLVRGMSYYTGTIFEIAIPEFGGSCGGGGRYDEMIGKFTGQNVPACGFSIGFERIILLLLEQDFRIPTQAEKIAFLVDRKCSSDKMVEVMKEAAALRKEGKQVLVSRMNKNKKFQKEQLANQGYAEFVEFFND